MNRLKQLFKDQKAKQTRGKSSVDGSGYIPDGHTEGPEVIIIVVGETGSGKSTLINNIVGRDVANVGHGLESRTKSITPVDWTYKNRKIKLFDTPGFDDSDVPDAKLFEMIAEFLQDLYERRVYVNGILFLHPLTSRRFRGSSKRQLDFMEKLIGQSSLKNVIFVLTFADNRDPGEVEVQLEQLKRSYWRVFLQKNARVFIKDGPKSARTVIDMVLSNQKTILDLQRELVDEKRTLLATSAGETFKEDTEQTIATLESDIKMMRGEGSAGIATVTVEAIIQDSESEDRIEALVNEVKKLRNELAGLDKPIPRRLTGEAGMK